MELLEDRISENSTRGTHHLRIYRDVVADDQGPLYDGAIEFVSTGVLPAIESKAGRGRPYIPHAPRDLDPKGIQASRDMNANGGVIIEFYHPDSGRAARVNHTTDWTGRGWFSYFEARTRGRYPVQEILLTEGLAVKLAPNKV